MSGISQPIEYCTSRSATMSQWNTFAVVPYCKRAVMRFLNGVGRVSSNRKAGVTHENLTHEHCGVSSGLSESRGSVRHRIDGSAFALGGIGSRDRKRVPPDGLDDESVGRRRHSVANAEVHVKDAELEIGNGEQGVLLIRKLWEGPDLAKVGVIFEPYEQIRAELSRDARRGREIRLAEFSEPDVHDRVDDELVVRVTDPDDGPYLHGKPRLREFRRGVAELEIDPVEEITLLGVGLHN